MSQKWKKRKEFSNFTVEQLLCKIGIMFCELLINKSFNSCRLRLNLVYGSSLSNRALRPKSIRHSSLKQKNDTYLFAKKIENIKTT